MPHWERREGIDIFRYPGRERDMLARASGFARFVDGHTRRLAPTLELSVFRDPWGGYPALRAAPDCPAIFEVNALPSWELPYTRPGFLQSPALAAKIGDMERACLRDAAKVLCVSEVTRRALATEGVPLPKSIRVPNAASEVYFSPPPCPLPELTTEEWCGYVGALQPWQGVEFLLEAFSLTRRGKLLIVHSGNRGTMDIERRVAKLGLGDRVRLEPPRLPEELAGIFAALRFTVAPLAETARNTWQGCCPVKIVESMATGTPVLASDLEVCRELIRHGETGWLAPAGNKRAWAIALEHLFSDAAAIGAISSAARSAASGQQAAHDALAEVFRTVAAGPRYADRQRGSSIRGEAR